MNKKISFLTSRYVVVLFFVVVCMQLTAGDKYREGYVLTLQGDTLHGFLLYQNSLYASKSCKFRVAPDANLQQYGPNDILGYRFLDGKYYISKDYVVDSTHVERVFMEYLIHGIANMYFFVDDRGDHYFVEKEGFGLIELTEKKATYDGINPVPSKYKGKLGCVMDDAPDLAKQIDRTALSPQSLIKLAKVYHEKVCNTDSCIIYEKRQLKTSVSFRVLGGISKNKYLFGPDLESNYGTAWQLGMGMVVENIIHTNERIKVHVDMLLGYSSAYTIAQTPGSYFTTTLVYKGETYRLSLENAYDSQESMEVKLNVVDMTIPIVVNYYIPIQKSSLYLGLGVSNKITLSQTKDLIYTPFDDAYGKLINTYLLGMVGNLGYTYQLPNKHSLGLAVNYQHFFNIGSLNRDVRLTNNQVNIHLTYSLGGTKKRADLK